VQNVLENLQWTIKINLGAERRGEETSKKCA
jgi:hypothetical protein